MRAMFGRWRFARKWDGVLSARRWAYAGDSVSGARALPVRANTRIQSGDFCTVMIQQLKNSSNPAIIDNSVVLGTVDDLKQEHDWHLARIHKLREKLHQRCGGYEPLMTGKKQRESIRIGQR